MVLLFVVVFFTSRHHVSRSNGPAANVASQASRASVERERVFEKVFEHLAAAAPPPAPHSVSELRPDDCQIHDVGLNPDADVQRLSYDTLDRCYQPSAAQLQALETAHTRFRHAVESELALEADAPVFDALFPRERGIVTVGGGKYSLLSYSMIRVLREHGSQLPVEVLIPPQDEGDDHYCDSVLPALNARCVFMRDLLPASVASNWHFKQYQIKSVALLFSSFKKIIFIDADNYPVKNVDLLFESDVFATTGLVLWPDMWRRLTPPAFYRLAHVDVDLSTRVRHLGDDVSPVSQYQKPDADAAYNRAHVPLHDLDGTVSDPTSETGQLVLDKVRHFDTLLLAFYYNLYGQDWYYYMFSQGTSGQGDKETFAMAAHVLGKPYYQVKTKIDLDGYWAPDDSGFKGVGLLQHDASEDYLVHGRAEAYVRENYATLAEYNPDYNVDKVFYNGLLVPEGKDAVDVMFVHASYHKLEPWGLYKERTYIDNDGGFFRSFKKIHRLRGFDIELFQFQLLNNAVCSDKKIQFKYLQEYFEKEEWPRVCEYIGKRLQYLMDTHEEAVAEN